MNQNSQLVQAPIYQRYRGAVKCQQATHIADVSYRPWDYHRTNVTATATGRCLVQSANDRLQRRMQVDCGETHIDEAQTSYAQGCGG